MDSHTWSPNKPGRKWRAGPIERFAISFHKTIGGLISSHLTKPRLNEAQHGARTNYKAKVDFENGDHWTHTVDVGVAKRLSNVPVVLSATLEKPLDGGHKEYQVNVTMTYYFER